MLKVCKIDLCPAALFGAVGSVKAQGQLDERAHGRRRGAHVAQELFAVVREHFREFFAVLFAQGAHLLYILGKLGIGRIQKPAERGEAHGQLLPRPVPAEGARARERAQRKRGIRAARAVFFGDDLVFGRPLANIVHPLRPVLRRGADLLEDLRAPDGFSCVVGVGFYCLQLLAQPLCRARVALRFAVQREHRFRKAIVAPTGPHRVGKELKALVGRFIALIEHALDNALLYRLRPVLLDDLELRRKLRRVAVFAQEALAERVDRADLCLGAQCALPLEPAVIWICGKALGYLVEYSAAKLRGRGLGEGYDQEAVDIGIVLYSAKQALGEHPCFSASGRRRHKHGASGFLDRAFLRRCWLKPRHLPRLPPERSTPSLQADAE